MLGMSKTLYNNLQAAAYCLMLASQNLADQSNNARVQLTLTMNKFIEK